MPKISYFWLFLIVVFAVVLSYRTIYAQLPAAPSATSPAAANPGAANSGVSTFTISWTDNSTDEANFEVAQTVSPPGDTVLGTPVATGGTGTVSTFLTGNYTSDGTTYYNFQVVAINATGRSPGSGTAGQGPDRIAPTSAAPTISSGTLGSNGWYTSTVSMYISSADAVGVTLEKHKRNAEAYNVGSATDTWADTDDGTDTWYGYAQDSEGNYRDAADSLVVKVDQTAPATSASSLSEGTNPAYQYASGTTIYYNNAGTGDFSVSNSPTDATSGVAKATFPTMTGFTGGGDDTTSPYSALYSWTGATTYSGSPTLTATDNAGLVSPSGGTFTVTLDITAPTGLALSWGAIDSSSITVTATGSTLADAGAGVKSPDPVLIQYTANATAFVTADGSSGWRGTAAWTATGLSANTPHAFRIIARDNVENLTTALTPTPAYKYTMAANADVVESSGIGTATWATANQRDNPTLTFTFSSANLDASPKKIQYYEYIWDISPTTDLSVAVGLTTTSSGAFAFPNDTYDKRNSKSLYLHALAYNGDDQPVPQGTQHYGPFYCVETKRRLRGGKFFDDDGNLVELR